MDEPPIKITNGKVTVERTGKYGEITITYDWFGNKAEIVCRNLSDVKDLSDALNAYLSLESVERP